MDYETIKLLEKIEKNTRKTAGVLRFWNFLIFLGTIIYILS